MNFGSIVWGAIQPVLTVCIVVVLGAFLKRKNIYHQAVMKSLGVLALQVLSPCLLISKIAVSINLGNMPQYLTIMAISLGYFVFLFIAAGIIYYTTKKYQTPTFRTSILSATSFGNVGDFPIAILTVLGDSTPFMMGDADKGIAFITAILLVYFPLFFSIGLYWIEQDYKSIKSDDFEQLPETTAPIVQQKTPFYKSKLFKLIFLNPNIIGIIIGLLFALIPPFNYVFVTKDGPLHFIFKLIQTIGNAYIPIGLTLFGANLTYANFGIFMKLLGRPVIQTMPTTIYVPISIIIVFKLVICPVIGIFFVKLLASVDLIDKSNAMLQFVLMTPLMMPMAQMNLILAQIYHPKGKPEEMATLVAICYIVAPISLIASLSGAIYSVSLGS